MPAGRAAVAATRWGCPSAPDPPHRPPQHLGGVLHAVAIAAAFASAAALADEKPPDLLLGPVVEGHIAKRRSTSKQAKI